MSGLDLNAAIKFFSLEPIPVCSTLFVAPGPLLSLCLSLFDESSVCLWSVFVFGVFVFPACYCLLLLGGFISFSRTRSTEHLLKFCFLINSNSVFMFANKLWFSL